MSNMLQDSIVLITGGTGTFGQAFVKRCLANGAAEVRVFSRDEKKQSEMAQLYREKPVKFFIGDIRDMESLLPAMKDVDYVFHAAAMKHVPLCEQFPLEAIKTNIIGSNNVFDLAISCGVKKVACLSTDKAVYPVSAMGLTKSYMEKIALQKARAQSTTQFCVTRFCNLIESSGSVVPLFINQIKQGKKLTVTDPEMTRYMMTIDEAMDLVEKTLVEGNNGEVFIKRAKSCRIGDLATAVWQFVNSSSSAEIEIIGPRPGERKHEFLMTEEEAAGAIGLDDYIIINPNGRNSDTGMKNYKSNEATQLSIEEIVDMIKRS